MVIRFRYLLLVVVAAMYTTATPSAKRIKRFVIFDGSGVVKFVVGVSYPIQLVDKQRALSYFYNFQAQYIPPPRPLYWWSYFNTIPFVTRDKKPFPLHWDQSRSWCYSALETALESFGDNGRLCLQRIICAVSQVPFHIQASSDASIYAELLNALLIPRIANVSKKYVVARDIGADGGDCVSEYPNCNERIWRWFLNVANKKQR